MRFLRVLACHASFAALVVLGGCSKGLSETQKDEVSDIATDAASDDVDTSELESKITEMESKIEDLETRLSDAEGKASEVDDHEDRISELERRVSY